MFSLIYTYERPYPSLAAPETNYWTVVFKSLQLHRGPRIRWGFLFCFGSAAVAPGCRGNRSLRLFRASSVSRSKDLVGLSASRASRARCQASAVILTSWKSSRWRSLRDLAPFWMCFFWGTCLSFITWCLVMLLKSVLFFLGDLVVLLMVFLGDFGWAIPLSLLF